MDDQNQTQLPATSGSFNSKLAIGVIGFVIVAGAVFVLSNSKTNTVSQPSKGSVAGISTSINQEKSFAVEGGNFYFKPNEIRVKKGDKVKITLSSVRGFHDFVLDEFNAKTILVPSGEKATVEFTPDKTGTFEFYCSVGNHRQMGMKGNLIVE